MKNFRVVTKASLIVTGDEATISNVKLTYKKLLLIFTYRDAFEPE
jgi:hypothetical protein